MSYSISLVLHPHVDKKGLQLVRILVIYNRKKASAKTVAKVTPGQINGDQIVNHPQEKKLNSNIRAQVKGIEDRLLDALRDNCSLTVRQLEAIVKNEVKSLVRSASKSVIDYFDSLQDSFAGKLSDGKLRQYAAVTEKVRQFKPSVTFSDITSTWLNAFEKHLRGIRLDPDNRPLSPNTLNNNLSILRAMLNKAEVDGMLPKEQFRRYKVPKYEQTIPVFLTETELTAVLNLVRSLGPGNMKKTGYYFLLSCFAGYRIGDARKFNYEERVQDNMIALRAAKNGRIVSIPVHTRLKEVLEYIKENGPIDISEQNMRGYVKDICGLAGIRKHVKFHTSRHSFAMLLMKSGFTIDEVAHLLGDTLEVARVYARIYNPALNAKVMDLLG